MNTLSPAWSSTDEASTDISRSIPSTTEAHEAAAHEAARIGEMARDWWQRHTRTALDLSDKVKEEVAVAGDRTRRYVRDEPLRSMALATAAGAAVGALLVLFGRRR